jgi:esterase/lipase superfamily enzyme
VRAQRDIASIEAEKARLKQTEQGNQKKIELDGQLRRRPALIFVTDRNDEGGLDWQTRFGSRRLAEWRLTCGAVDFADFQNREFGESYSKALISFKADQEIQELKGVRNCANFILDTARKTRANDILFLTHGYQNTFSDTIAAAKSLADDTNFSGLVVVWSWPSNGWWFSYTEDEKAVAWSEPHFTELSISLLSAADLHLDFLAHSMGNHLLLGVVQAMRANGLSGSVNALVFAAPDVDQSEFRQKATIGYSHFYTMYASTDDWALRMSKIFHRSNGIRAGTGGENGILLMRGLESIDTNVTGHSYVFGDPRAMRDVELLLKTHAHASARGLASRTRGSDTYWIINP